MTCRKVRKLMPLFAGDDLGPQRTRAVRAHLDVCPGCRRELDAFKAALARVKAAAKAESVTEWSEGEWQDLMARATRGTQGLRDKAAGLGQRVLRPRWAAASALGAAIGLAALFILLRWPGPGPTERPAGPTALADAARAQDVVTLTMVSPESGLQIVWFFDKKFDYEGAPK